MPITTYQQHVLGLLAQQRNPSSYVAGGIAIQRIPNSKRYSKDIDLFHDLEQSIATSSQQDIAVLRQQGHSVETLLNQPSFVRALVSKGDASLTLEWVQDTAFRFYPTIEDDLLGYRLHDVDLAINKCLALSNRNEVRDIIDLVHLEGAVMPLSVMLWGACGKDPGFTPPLLLQCIRRHSLIRSEQLDSEALVESISPTELKKQWLELLDSAEEQLRHLPDDDLGCIYVDEKGNPYRGSWDPFPASVVRHFGSVGGSWPRVC